MDKKRVEELLALADKNHWNAVSVPVKDLKDLLDTLTKAVKPKAPKDFNDAFNETIKQHDSALKNLAEQ